ncbi:endoplasmic oxidoreductin 1 [Hamiltosporidium magnivora]|uniref:Endoplasmic oxidoreductin 1 n=1 Tax=Hamiltosporidium magnivora TaxID=148818 RepID=A0A4Q9KVP2_9MICR|nr:endoplasmic oxidoreductin 1 [Hamiltosporidium magnivora]
MKIFFLFIVVFTNTKVYSSIKQKIISFNSEIHGDLKILCESDFFSKIRINLNGKCNYNFGKKCGLFSCNVPEQSKINQKINNNDLYCKNDGTEGVCIDLIKIKEIFTGYKKESGEVWKKIYEFASKNKDIMKIISGIHYSVCIHMCRFYRINRKGEYIANTWMFHKKKNLNYEINLYFAFLFISSFFKATNFNVEILKSSLKNNELESFFRVSKFADLHVWTNTNINLSSISEILNLLNCLGCERCKLWSKIQFGGVETAIKLSNEIEISENDLIYFVNLLYKLSSSIKISHEFEKIKFPFMCYFNIYKIEIFTIIISLSLFYLLRDKNKCTE